MDSSNNIFPLFFTIERVENGYILQSKDADKGQNAETAYRKEVVTDDKINARIGQLLRLDTLKNEIPLTFYVEAATEQTYMPVFGEQKSDALMEAKLRFYQYQQKHYEKGQVLALQIAESQTIELYGAAAERIALANNLSLMRQGGIHMLRYPVTKDARKQIASFRPQILVLDVSESSIFEWCKNHAANPAFT